MSRALSAFQRIRLELAVTVAVDRLRNARVTDPAQIRAEVLAAARDATDRPPGRLRFDPPSAAVAGPVRPDLGAFRGVVGSVVGPWPSPRPETVLAAVETALGEALASS